MISNVFHLATEEALQAFAANMARVIKPGAVVFLQGPLGAGKTTFTRGFLRELGYKGKVKSPTFTLVESYDFENVTVFHFDLYRIEDQRALEEIGIREYLSPASICLIEWPEKGSPLLPEPDVACYISFAASGRDVRIETRKSEVMQDLILKLQAGQ